MGCHRVRGLVGLIGACASLVLALGCSSPPAGAAAVDASPSTDVRAMTSTAPDSGAHDAFVGGDARPHDGGPRDGHEPRDGREAAPPDGPTETTLVISPLEMVPKFSAAVHDYYVRCAAGRNAVTVTTTAARGSTIALAQPITTPAAVADERMIELEEGDAVVALVTTTGSGSAPEEYWVRCLPHDFPQILMTTHADAGTPSPGYYLLGDVVLAPGEGGYAMAIDQRGVPVWYHTTVTGQGAVDVDSLTPGTISFVPNLPDTYSSVSGQFVLLDLASPDAGPPATVESVGVPLDMHELRLLSNGDYLVLADPIIRGVDLTGLPGFGPEEDMVGCLIQELSPAGAVVWQWDITQHLEAVKDSTWPQVYPVDGKTVSDPFHCNSIDVTPDGDLLVSARHLDSIFLVSRSSGAILWKMGGVPYNLDGAPYIRVVGDPMTQFHRQHDVRMLPDGYISMFDDQTDLTGPARAIVYSYNLAAGTASIVWAYPGAMTSLAMGSVRIEPDGARVIGWGVGWGVLGPTNRALTELDRSGNDLLDFGFPDGDDSYRAVKIPLDQIDIGVLRRTSGAR